MAKPYHKLYCKKEEEVDTPLNLEIADTFGKPRRNYWWLYFIGGLIILGYLFYSNWLPVPGKKGLEYNDESGEARVTENWRIKSLKRAKEFERKVTKECQQYRLIARIPKFYSCFTCKTDKIFLQPGETWRIGVTCDRLVRYSQKFLKRNSLDYVVEYEGDMTTAYIIEKKKLILYLEMPENLKRGKDALLLSPGNSIEK